MVILLNLGINEMVIRVIHIIQCGKKVWNKFNILEKIISSDRSGFFYFNLELL